MKRVICCVLFGLFFFCCSTLSAVADSGGSLPDPGRNPMQIVLAEIAGQVVSRMVAEPLYRNISLGEITGDDGTLHSALRAAIVSATDYNLLDYDILQQILAEKKRQAAKTMDTSALNDSSKTRDAGWLLSGRIIDKIDHPLYSSLEVFLEMENMETGEIAFSQNFGASYIPPLTKYLIAALVLLAGLLLVISVNRKRRIKSISQAVDDNDKAQLLIANELKKARDNLKRVHDTLVDAEKMQLALQVKEQQDELDLLLRSVEQHPGVQPESVSRQNRKDQGKQNKFMQGLVRNIQVESEKMLKYVKKGNDVASETCLAELAHEIKNSRNKSYNNMAGRA